jgi:hypothetical protein
MGGDGGRAAKHGGRAAKDGGDSLVHAKSCAAMGLPLPHGLFAPPPPPHATTPVSMNVLVCMFMLRVKPQHYLEPSGV